METEFMSSFTVFLAVPTIDILSILIELIRKIWSPKISSIPSGGTMIISFYLWKIEFSPLTEKLFDFFKVDFVRFKQNLQWNIDARDKEKQILCKEFDFVVFDPIIAFYRANKNNFFFFYSKQIAYILRSGRVSFFKIQKT